MTTKWANKRYEIFVEGRDSIPKVMSAVDRVLIKKGQRLAVLVFGDTQSQRAQALELARASARVGYIPGAPSITQGGARLALAVRHG